MPFSLSLSKGFTHEINGLDKLRANGKSFTALGSTPASGQMTRLSTTNQAH